MPAVGGARRAPTEEPMRTPARFPLAIQDPSGLLFGVALFIAVGVDPCLECDVVDAVPPGYAERRPGQGVYDTDDGDETETDDDTPDQDEGDGGETDEGDGTTDEDFAWAEGLEINVKKLSEDERKKQLAENRKQTDALKKEQNDVYAKGYGYPKAYAVREGKGEDVPHLKNFVQCVQTRKKTNADVETAHRATTLCHLMNLCRVVQRKLQWDPKAEQFVGDAEANKLLSRPRRQGYELPRMV